MPEAHPHLDVATVDVFLRRHLGAPVTNVRALRGGEICTVFAYTLGDADYVIRFSMWESGFVHDRLAYERFTPAGIPIPRIIDIGRVGDRAFAIATLCLGRALQQIPAAQQDAVAPAVVALLDRIHQIDVSATTGYGDMDDTGTGRSPSWTASLQAITQEDPNDFYGYWSRLYDESFLERPLCEHLVAEMMALLPSCPQERALVHGDYGFDNVLVEGERITAVLDWANMKYGDALFDVAWLSFWPSPVRYADLCRRFYAEQGRAVPQYEERIRCYTCYIGLVALRFFAHTGQRAPYDWACGRLHELLGIGRAEML